MTSKQSIVDELEDAPGAAGKGRRRWWADAVSPAVDQPAWTAQNDLLTLKHLLESVCNPDFPAVRG